MATLTKVGSATLTSPVLAGGLTNSSITTTTARPYSLSTMDVSTGLRYDALNRKLVVESTLGEVFNNIGGDVVFTGKAVSLPNKCIVRVSSEKGARSQAMPLINPLTGVPRYGTDQPQQGYGRSRTLEYMKIYYNEYSQAVVGEKWGMHYNDLQVYDYYAQEQPGLSKWFAEYEGRCYREALLERYSQPLEGTGTSLTQIYNPNWFVANTELGSQPTYSSDASTHRTNINTAFQAADTGANGVNANIDLDYLLALDYFAQNNKRIKPVDIGGKQSYVVMLPSTQYHKLLQDNSGQLGDIWTKVTSLTDEEQNYPGIVGRVKSLVIVEDQRYPTLSCSNGYSNNAHITAYVQPGNVDSRNKSVYNTASNADWDIGFLMGEAALVDWVVTPLHYEMENTEFGKIYEHGAFTERGIQLGVYDTDTNTNLNIKNFGSIVLAFTATSIVTTA